MAMWFRGAFFEYCRHAAIGGQIEEVGSGLGHDAQRTLPAYALVPNWVLEKPTAFDLTVTSPIILNEASVTSGSTAQTAEDRKRASNDTKCFDHGCMGECAFGSRPMAARVLKQ